MPNYRVFYPIHYIALGPEASTSGQWVPIHGLQSVNMTTTFNLEQVFELGQLDIYQNIENLPNVEMTLEKLLDGYPLIYHAGTRGATTKTLLNRTNRKCDATLGIFSDSQDNASGLPLTQVYCSGMYVNSLNYTLPVTGNCRESVTLIGNDKLWRTSNFAFTGSFTGGDSPASGVQRRNHVIMGASAAGGSIWPPSIPGMTAVSSSGYNITDATGQFGAHLQEVTISASLSREDLFELGRLRPYYRYARFPVAVSCTITANAGGNTPGDLINADGNSQNNVADQPIVVNLADGTKFDLGTKNRLQSVTYSGGDTGGSIVTIAFAYQNFNNLSVTQPNDPEHLI